MKTYKKFFSVIIILIASISMTLAGPVHIEKKGGEIHIDGTVRYRSVESQTYADGSLNLFSALFRDTQTILLLINKI